MRINLVWAGECWPLIALEGEAAFVEDLPGWPVFEDVPDNIVDAYCFAREAFVHAAIETSFCEDAPSIDEAGIDFGSHQSKYGLIPKSLPQRRS